MREMWLRALSLPSHIFAPPFPCAEKGRLSETKFATAIHRCFSRQLLSELSSPRGGAVQTSTVELKRPNGSWIKAPHEYIPIVFFKSLRCRIGNLNSMDIDSVGYHLNVTVGYVRSYISEKDDDNLNERTARPFGVQPQAGGTREK